MTETESPARYAVANEVMAAITASTSPLCAQQLLPLCESAESAEQISKTLHGLKKRRAIVEDGPVQTKAGPRKSYRLPTEAEKLMAHLETELHARAESGEIPTVRYPLSAILEPAADDLPSTEACIDLDTVAHSHNGDEMHRCKCHAPAHQVSDPVIAAIERLSEPHWLGGLQDALRLRALARCPLLASQVDVIAWLDELADVIEGMSS